VACEDAEEDCGDEHSDECGDDHTVSTITAPEEYPADEENPQVVAQIDEDHGGRIRTPGLEQFARANAEHIATSNPSTVLAMVRELRRLRRVEETAKAYRKTQSSADWIRLRAALAGKETER
jgi:hypothetical protein